MLTWVRLRCRESGQAVSVYVFAVLRWGLTQRIYLRTEIDGSFMISLCGPISGGKRDRLQNSTIVVIKTTVAGCVLQ